MTTLCARLIYQAWSQSWVVSLAMGLARKALDHGVWCAHRWYHWETIVWRRESWILILNTTHANLLLPTNKAVHVTFTVNMKELAWFVKGKIHTNYRLLNPNLYGHKRKYFEKSVFFVHGIQCCLVPVGKIIWNSLPSIFFLCSTEERKVWNDMMVSKCWQNFQFWCTVSLKHHFKS